MPKCPDLIELYEAIMNDCFKYLDNNSSSETKESLKKLFNMCLDKTEIYKKSYSVFCSIYYEEPSMGQYESLFYYTKEYINNIFNYLSTQNNETQNNNKASFKDCCKAYIAFIGYKYILTNNLEKGLFIFSLQTNENFTNLLNRYDLYKDIKKYYNDIFIHEWITNQQRNSEYQFQFLGDNQKKEKEDINNQEIGALENKNMKKEISSLKESNNNQHNGKNENNNMINKEQNIINPNLSNIRKVDNNNNNKKKGIINSKTSNNNKQSEKEEGNNKKSKPSINNKNGKNNNQYEIGNPKSQNTNEKKKVGENINNTQRVKINKEKEKLSPRQNENNQCENGNFKSKNGSEQRKKGKNINNTQSIKTNKEKEKITQGQNENIKSLNENSNTSNNERKIGERENNNKISKNQNDKIIEINKAKNNQSKIENSKTENSNKISTQEEKSYTENTDNININIDDKNQKNMINIKLPNNNKEKEGENNKNIKNQNYKALNNKININENSNISLIKTGKELNNNDIKSENNKTSSIILKRKDIDNNKLENNNMSRNNHQLNSRENINNPNETININSQKVEADNNMTVLNEIVLSQALNKSLVIISLNSEIQFLKFNLKFIDIKNDFDKIVNFEFNSTKLDVEKKKIEHLETIITSLNNIIKNLANPYNFNLWRKISNIILKNILVILYKKNYTFPKYYQSSILTQLQINKSKFPKGKGLDIYTEKINEYTRKLNEQKKKEKKNDISNANSAADKERNYNLIVVKYNNYYDVRSSLVIDFLFYLKEKGNKINHLDKEIIDLILFDDLNINIIKDEIEGNEDKKDEFESENKNINEKEKIKYKEKTFTYKEILEMLKNPMKYHKKEVDLNKICENIYNKIEKIEKNVNYFKNFKKVSDLKNDSINFGNEIQNLIDFYEEYFSQNGINYKEKGNYNQDKNINVILDNFEQIKKLKEKNNNKIKLYEEINNELISLNTIKNKTKEEIDKLIKTAKNENIRKNKLISLTDIFNEYKSQLINKINDKKDKSEYKNYNTIFNVKNISEFKIDHFYSFLEEHLNYNNASFSITKKDITNFNCLIEVITEFNEIKNYIYNQDLDIQIYLLSQ